jgi:uncharacterized protein involved in exopolysaccharide biosynthesis
MDLKKENLSKEEKIQEKVLKIKAVLKLILENKSKLIAINAAIFLLTIIYLFLIANPYYESIITILPEYGSKNTLLNQFGDLAAMAGIKVGEGSPTEIYKNLVLGEAVLEPVIYSKYLTGKFKDSVDLIEYFKIKPDDKLNYSIRQRKMFLGIYKDLINNRIEANVDRFTKILTIKVTMPESSLSSEVANKIVNSLDYYIRTKRKSYATEQRIYIDRRIAQIQDSLTKAEDKLKVFKEQNRITVQSPSLLLEQERLTSNVQIFQSVFMELTKQLELARIDEIKDTPVINVKEYTREPIVKSGPKRLSILIIVMFISVIITILVMMNRTKILTIYNLLKK